MLTILQGDALEKLRELPAESVQCCVTSPPYWGLRDYGTAQWEGGDEGCKHEGDQRYYTEKTAAVCSADAFSEPGQANIDRLKEGRWRNNGTCVKCGAVKQDSQLGLEKTPEEYVAKMVEVFREVRRVLRSDGTLWCNMGDSYWNGGAEKRDGGHGFVDGGKPKLEAAQGALLQARSSTGLGLKPKDLCGIPWRLAFALQADGWWLRSDIIWAKPNPMPESCTDRPTKSHEYLFLLTKSARYFFDNEAIKEPNTEGSIDRWKEGGERVSSTGKRNNRDDGTQPNDWCSSQLMNGRNKRSVWTVATAPYPEAHFATYPPDLIKPCILAGTSAKGCCAKCGAPWERVVEINDPNGRLGKGYHDHKNDLGVGQRGVFPAEGAPTCETTGWQPNCDCGPSGMSVYTNGRETFHGDFAVPCTVLDPFGGSGTTGAVALELGRKAVLIELNPKYIELIEQRCNVTPGLALA